MNPAHSIRLRGAIPFVTIMDKPTCPDDMPANREFPAAYPSPTEPNYYIPLLEPPTPSTMADSITHHLLDRIIHDAVAKDNTADTRKHAAPAGTTTTHPRSSPPSDTTTNRATANSNGDSPDGDHTKANDAQDAHNPHNDEDEQPTKRTKTATDTTDPIDDTQEFSLWIPLERSVTDTVYQLIAQMFRKLSNDKTLQFIHSNKSTVPAPVCGIPDEEDMVGRHKERILCNMAGLNSRISIEILTRQHGRNRRRTPTPPKAGNSKHKKGTEYTGDDGTDPTGTGQDHTRP